MERNVHAPRLLWSFILAFLISLAACSSVAWAEEAENVVAKIGTSEYTTITAALDYITVDNVASNITINVIDDCTLESGILKENPTNYDVTIAINDDVTFTMDGTLKNYILDTAPSGTGTYINCSGAAFTAETCADEDFVGDTYQYFALSNAYDDATRNYIRLLKNHTAEKELSSNNISKVLDLNNKIFTLCELDESTTFSLNGTIKNGTIKYQASSCISASYAAVNLSYITFDLTSIDMWSDKVLIGNWTSINQSYVTYYIGQNIDTKKITVKGENGTLTYKAMPRVAQIGETKYASLEEAIAKAISGDTINIYSDVAVTLSVSFGDKNLTIQSGDSNTHTITITDTGIMDGGSTATVTLGEGVTLVNNGLLAINVDFASGLTNVSSIDFANSTGGFYAGNTYTSSNSGTEIPMEVQMTKGRVDCKYQKFAHAVAALGSDAIAAIELIDNVTISGNLQLPATLTSLDIVKGSKDNDINYTLTIGSSATLNTSGCTLTLKWVPLVNNGTVNNFEIARNNDESISGTGLFTNCTGDVFVAQTFVNTPSDAETYYAYVSVNSALQDSRGYIRLLKNCATGADVTLIADKTISADTSATLTLTGEKTFNGNSHSIAIGENASLICDGMINSVNFDDNVSASGATRNLSFGGGCVFKNCTGNLFVAQTSAQHNSGDKFQYIDVLGALEDDKANMYLLKNCQINPRPGMSGTKTIRGNGTGVVTLTVPENATVDGNASWTIADNAELVLSSDSSITGFKIGVSGNGTVSGTGKFINCIGVNDGAETMDGIVAGSYTESGKRYAYISVNGAIISGYTTTIYKNCKLNGTIGYSGKDTQNTLKSYDPNGTNQRFTLDLNGNSLAIYKVVLDNINVDINASILEVYAISGTGTIKLTNTSTLIFDGENEDVLPDSTVKIDARGVSKSRFIVTVSKASQLDELEACDDNFILPSGGSIKYKTEGDTTGAYLTVAQPTQPPEPVEKYFNMLDVAYLYDGMPKTAMYSTNMSADEYTLTYYLASDTATALSGAPTEPGEYIVHAVAHANDGSCDFDGTATISIQQHNTTTAPTTAPTGTPAPTNTPTAESTNTPTPAPTDMPTAEPTDNPANTPTGEATAQPTTQPTGTPAGDRDAWVKATTRLNMRAAAGTGSRILGQYPYGTHMVVHSVNGEWAKVTMGGKDGYVMEKYITYVRPASQPTQTPQATQEPGETPEQTPDPEGSEYRYAVTTPKDGKSNIVMRKSALASAKVVAYVPCHNVIEVTSAGKSWTAVKYGTRSGYIRNDKIKLFKTQSEAEEYANSLN